MAGDARCARHPEQPSAAVCSSCLKKLCSDCIQFAGHHTVCAECRVRFESARMRRNIVIAVVAGAGGLLLLAVIVVVIFSATRDSYEYGRFAPVVEANRKALKDSPCDRSAAIALADALSGAGDARGTLSFVHDYMAKCGEEPRLRWATFGSHKQLGEWDAALSDANKLIEVEPQDRDYRWWRAQVWEHKGKLDRAAEDYEKAIELEPRLTNIPINLASVYERMKRPCDAAKTLRTYIATHPEVSETISPRADSLERQCGPK